MAFQRGDVVLVPFHREVDFMTQPTAVVQTLAEESLTAAIAFAATHTPGVNIERLKQLLGESQSIP